MSIPPQDAPLLTAEHLAKSFGRRKVVQDFSLDVRAGEVVGLLGRNGAGKTTTFRMIVGLIGADAGVVRLRGIDITRDPMYRRARAGLGYLPQETSVFRRMTVEQNLLAVIETREPVAARRQARADALLGEFGLTHVRDNLAEPCSGGEKRRLEIARALALEPAVMLLDEPFAGVDPIAVSDIQNIVRGLKERGLGVLLTDHNVRETLAITDRSYIIDEGRVLAEGAPADIVANHAVRKTYLGEHFTL